MLKKFALFVIATLLIGCSGSSSPLPAAPTAIPSAPAVGPGVAPGPATGPAPPTPTPFGVWPISETYASLQIGEVINGRVTESDPSCITYLHMRCRYYRVQAPSDGLLEVVVMSESMGPRYADAPLDLYITNVTDERGKGWDPVFGPGPQLRVSARVKAGAHYQISLYSWSPTLPGVQFELRSSMWPE